jgi:hypothetical protein
LNASVTGVQRVDIPGIILRHCAHTVELAITRTMFAKPKQELSRWVKHLDPVNAADHDLVIDTQAYSQCRAELPLTFTERAEREEELAVRIKYLNTVVALVCQNVSPLAVNDHADGIEELALCVPSLTEGEQDVTGLIKHLDAIVACVKHSDVAIPVNGNSRRAKQLSDLGSKNTERSYERSTRIEDLNPMVERIGDDEIAI